MKKLHLCIGLVAGLAVGAAAAPALAQNPARSQTQSPTPAHPLPPGDSNGNYMGQGRGAGLLGFLSPEQRAIYLQEEDQRDMTPKQRRTWRQDEHQKLGAMSETDRQKLKIDLQKKWDALPQDQKKRIEARLANRMTQQNSGLQ